MASKSAGIVPFRNKDGEIQVLLVHPGGPFWRNKDEGAWSIAKGEHAEDEQPAAAASREFTEETGWVPVGTMLDLGEIRQPGGKRVRAFALNADYDPQTLSSNTFELEWPPRSSRVQTFPEVDRAQWFGLEEARRKIIPGQRPFIEQLAQLRSLVRSR